MIAGAVANGNSPSVGENDLLVGYNKIISIRDSVFAKETPVKILNQSTKQANARSTTGALPLRQLDGPATEAPNGTQKPSKVNSAAFPQPSNLSVPKTRSVPLKPKSPNVQNLPTPSSKSSGIDPIFLTKSDVLVRAEIHQKRQRLERALEEQVHKLRKQNAVDHEALPDFDVTEVLRKAQELVKPIKLLESSRVNAGASSSDSFDENTFYSSQMDESTTTEEADESHKRRPNSNKICSFFLRGERCKYGDKCIFSHDPALKQRLEAEGSQVVDLDRVNADEQTSARKNNASNKRARTNATQPKPPVKEIDTNIIPAQSQEERERKERIARLEAELRSAKAEQEGLPDVASRHGPKETHDYQGEPAYSPPGPDEFGRDVGLREPESRQAAVVPQRHAAPDGQPQNRVYGRRNGNPPTPLPSDGRIVTSHIRSPVAPQPSRVSPLAVAKVPQVSQIQREYGENRRSSRASNVENVSAGQSPNVASQPRSSRKRRRGLDPVEQIRNVVSRTDFGSPVIRIKEEPASPPPFDIAAPNMRQVRPRQEGPRQVYVDTVAPQYRDQEPFHQQTRIVERAAYDQMNDGRAPQTPIIRRVVSRNGQRYVANGEQDLRRVVTAPRQVRAQMSPPLYPVEWSAPQPRATRVASQAYVSPIPRDVLPQYRASVQPPSAAYSQIDRSPSPPIHQMPQSPIERRPIAMAPPPRRIVVDQWGNRFMEAPMPIERHVSVAPMVRGNDYDPRYDQVAPRNPSVVRQPQVIRVDDEGHQYVRRAPSPSSNGCFEKATRQVIEPRSEYEDGAYVARDNDPRPINYAETRPAARYDEVPVQDARIVRLQSVRPVERQYEDIHAPDERIVRMQSVRPVERQYEDPREQIIRVQSVRPEQPRIVRLGETQEPGRQGTRHVSVRPGPEHVRQTGPPAERYEYVPVEQNGGYNGNRYPYQAPIQDRGYIEEMQEDSVLYKAPSSGGKRTMQRM